MTDTQIDALCELTGARDGPAVQAARLVLVQGIAPSEAARTTGATPQTTSDALRRLRRAHGLALVAAGANGGPQSASEPGDATSALPRP